MKGKTEILVLGLLDKKWSSYFDEAEIVHDKKATTLSVNIKDESHLHGILNKIRDLNLKIISVNPASQLKSENEFNN